jgi:hypothetical protein
MGNVQGAIDDIESKRAEFLKMVTTGDYATANAVELQFADAVQLYGSYATPLTARLAHTKALATTHYWLEASVRDSVANAQAEGDTPTTREKIPDRKSNTCQIVSGMVEVSGSAMQEAANGMYGSATDLLQFQAEAEMQGVIKDIERAVLLGTESTSDPRAMKGLQAWLTTNQVNVGGTTLGTAHVETLLTTISNQKTGHLPTAIYAPAAVLTAMAKWANNRVQFVADVGNLEALRNLQVSVGQAVGWYMTQFGPLELVLAPEVPYTAGTAALNYIYAVSEPLLRLADFRPLQTTLVVTSADSLTRSIVWEGTLEVRCEKAHGLIKNFTV